MNKTKILCSGGLAGGLIGFGGYLFILSKTYFSYIGQFVGALLFPIGLFLICELSLHLYTGKVGFLLSQEDISSYIIELLFMFIGNILGAVVVGVLLSFCTTNETILAVGENIAYRKMILPQEAFYDCSILFFNSCICGMLVYLAVRLYKQSTSFGGRFIGVWLPIFSFVYFGFDHCIADTFYVAFSFSTFGGNIWLVIGWITIAVLGNSLGAMWLDLMINFIKDKN